VRKWFRLCLTALLLVWVGLNIVNPAHASSVAPLYTTKPIQNIEQIAYRLRYIPNFVEGAANASAYTTKTVAYTTARAGALGRSFLFGPWGNAALLALTAAGYWWDSNSDAVGPTLAQSTYTTGYACYQDIPQSSSWRGYAPSRDGCTSNIDNNHTGLTLCPVQYNYCYDLSGLHVTLSGGSYYIRTTYKQCSNWNCTLVSNEVNIGHVAGGQSTGLSYQWPPNTQGDPLTDEELAPLFNPGGPLEDYAPDVYEDPNGDPLITPELQNTMDLWKQAMDNATDGDSQTVGDPTQLEDTTTTPDTTSAQTPEQVTDCAFFPTLCSWLDWFKAPPTDYITPPETPINEYDANTFTPWSTGFGSGTCPAPRTATVMGQTVTYDFTTACEGAAWFKPIIVAAAFISAGFILLGVRSS